MFIPSFTMRTLTALLLLAFCATICAKGDYKIADKTFLDKQKDILRLFKHINQPSYYEDFIEIANNYKFDDWEQYEKPEDAKEFWHYYTNDILPKGAIFTPLHLNMLWSMQPLFRLLCFAKDYESFFKIAVWARQNVNEGVFVYALSVAIVHSKLTKDIILPPIYEINPYYFYSTDVMVKAKEAKHSTTIAANYSGNINSEEVLNYYTQDVGLNSDYYYANILITYWMQEKFYGFKMTLHGELFFHYHQQRLARYYLERLSNGLGEIPYFEYSEPIETGFEPSLIYPNGIPFPGRPNGVNLKPTSKGKYPTFGNYTYYTYEHVIDYEKRLRQALDLKHFLTVDGKKIKLDDRDGLGHLANLLECNGDTLNDLLYLDITLFGRYLLGYAPYPREEFKLTPSAMEHLETSMRDPMFHQFFKRLLYLYQQHQVYAAPYLKTDLLFKGVEIQNVSIGKLITYFDQYQSDITNAIEFKENLTIKANQFRLNHDPFDYTIQVNSQEKVEALVKIFIGPKYDENQQEIAMDENRMNFFEIDRFRQTLNEGFNEIQRNSKESKLFSNDRIGLQEFEKQLNGGDFKIYDKMKYYGFPDRLMLPKGAVGGKTFQFYVMIAPYHAPAEENNFTKYYLDVEYSIGYPLDRQILFKKDFFVPNFHFKDVQIFHKKLEGVDATWSRQ